MGYSSKGLEEVDLLALLQLGFKKPSSADMALILLMDDLWWPWDGGNVSILAFLDLSTVFRTIHYGSLLDQLRSWK